MGDTPINLRARAEQRELIDQAAELLGKNRSDFMLDAACDWLLKRAAPTRCLVRAVLLW